MLIKICGLTSVADALAAAEAGADWIGLNFHPASPRFVEESVARDIVAAIPSSITPVGVFVDRDPKEILAVAARVGFSTVQLHGLRSMEDVAPLAILQVIRAFALTDEASVEEMVSIARRLANSSHPPRAILVDAFVPGLAGGTGQVIANDVLDRVAQIVPALPPLILAGGLNPGNVAERIARVCPWMVDAASGVESSPRHKDPDRMRAFVRSARTIQG